MSGDQLPSNLPAGLTQRPDPDFVLQAAGLGTWELDPLTNLVRWDERCRALFGVAKDTSLAYERVPVRAIIVNLALTNLARLVAMSVLLPLLRPSRTPVTL